MKQSLTSIALGALLLSQSVLAGLYSSADKVIELNTRNFQAEVMDSDHLVMVEFYAPWCGHCKNLTPHYKAAAKNLHGIVKLGAIDCDDDQNKPICGQYGIQGFPTIKVFPSSRTGKSSVKYPQDYQGERSGRAIVDHLVKMIPNDIQLVTSNPTSGKIINIDEFTDAEDSARALLFTKKTTSSNMYKGLATDMRRRMVVAEMRNPSSEILKKYDIDSLPALVVFPKDKKTHVTYSGELKREPLSDFFSQYAEPAKGSASQKAKKEKKEEEAPVVPFDPKVHQIEDQAEFKKQCLDKSIGSCAIAFLVVEPEFDESVKMHEENLEILSQVKKAAHDAKKPVHVMWMDALDKRVVDFMNLFQISSDIPGLLLINPNRKAFVPFMGRFDVEGIQEWLSDSNTGRSRAFPYTFDVSLAEKKAPKVKEEASAPVKDEL
ncbi:protein disulfide isomerase (PDI) protein [Podila verticillata]|nr:protein disulfide isomerase (PDI) protein [Podila verticillata]